MDEEKAREDYKEGSEILEKGERPKREILKKVLAGLIIAGFIASAAGNVFMLVKYSEKRDKYNELTVVHAQEYFVFPSITVDGFKEKVASGEEFVVLIGRPDCGSCRSVSNDFISFCKGLGIEGKVYYLNVVYLHRDMEAWVEFKQVYGLTGTPTFARYAGGEQKSALSWTEENGIDMGMITSWMYEQKDFFGLK